MRLADLNALSEDAAAAEFLRCCGSTVWADRMAAARPFAGADEMAAAADEILGSLGPADWLEAFAAHPEIGERPASAWASNEQAGAASAGDDVRDRLVRGNRRYQDRFGYIFIVCATGRTANAMLADLEHRLLHASDEELPIAAEEQRKITRLRLAKLLRDDAT